MRDIALLVLLLPMLWGSLRHVHTATMFWIWTALAGPTTFIYGFLASLPFNKVAVGATLVSVLVDRRKQRFFADGIFVLQTLFVLQGVISVALGVTDISRTYDLLDKMVKIWLLTVFMRIALRDRLALHSYVIAFTVSLGVHGMLEGIKYVVTLGGHRVVPSAIIGDNNYLALAILMLLPCGLWLGKYTARLDVRVAVWGFTGLMLFGLVATASRGGTIGLATLSMILIARSKRKGLGVLAVIVAGIGLVIFAPQSWLERMDSIKSAEGDGSFMSRVAAWKLNTLLALDRPLLGGGYSALEDPKVFNVYNPQIGLFDFITTPPLTGPMAAHSIYFSVLGDTGFVGLILFLSMLVGAFVALSQVKRAVVEAPDMAWATDLANALQASMVVFLVSGAALSASYFEILYIQITTICLLRRHVIEIGLEPGSRRLQGVHEALRTAAAAQSVPTNWPAPGRAHAPSRQSWPGYDRPRG